MSKILFGIIGISIVVVGWLLKQNSDLSTVNNVVITFVLSSICMTSFYFFSMQREYFLNLAKVIHKIEKFLKLFEYNWNVENELLFPKEWENFGSKMWKELIFIASFLSVSFLYIATIGLVWLKS